MNTCLIFDEEKKTYRVYKGKKTVVELASSLTSDMIDESKIHINKEMNEVKVYRIVKVTGYFYTSEEVILAYTVSKINIVGDIDKQESCENTNTITESSEEINLKKEVHEELKNALYNKFGNKEDTDEVFM